MVGDAAEARSEMEGKDGERLKAGLDYQHPWPAKVPTGKGF